MMQPGQEYTERENVALSLPELTGKLLHDAGYGSMAGKTGGNLGSCFPDFGSCFPVSSGTCGPFRRLHGSNGRNTGPWNFAIFPVMVGGGSFRGKLRGFCPGPGPLGSSPAASWLNTPFMRAKLGGGSFRGSCPLPDRPGGIRPAAMAPSSGKLPRR